MTSEEVKISLGSGRNLKQPWCLTPLIESPALSEAAGWYDKHLQPSFVHFPCFKILNRRSRIFLKLDNFQPSGSFKSRGIGNYMLKRIGERLASGNTDAIHFYASSGGNAGLACVHAAQSLGYPATVVVPTTANKALLTKLRIAGAANIVRHGQSVLDADRHLKSVVLKADPNGIYVPPFDHQDIWDGNATIMDEIADQLDGQAPDVVICSVGGGGLFNGIMQSLEFKGWSHVRVIAMETQGADSLNRSIRAGHLITMDRITSQARSLGVARVSDMTWEYAQRPQVISAALPDSEAARGSWLLAQSEKIISELTVGINVVICYDGLLKKLLGGTLTKSSKVVIVVCGGNDINVEMLLEWKKYSKPQVMACL